MNVYRKTRLKSIWQEVYFLCLPILKYSTFMSSKRYEFMKIDLFIKINNENDHFSSTY
jgi:hypothetical protein